MPRYRYNTVPTGAKAGAWRDTRAEALADAVADGMGEVDHDAPEGVSLDVLVVIEETGSAGLSEWELWACAAETLKQHKEKAPQFVAERIAELVLAGDMDGVATWKLIAAKLDELSRVPKVRQ